MLELVALAATLEGVGADYVPSLEALFEKHRQVESGDPFVVTQAVSDLNGDGVLDGVVKFSYAMGPNMDHTHSEFLTVVASSTTGYAASWPIIVGARGFRNIRRVEIEGRAITLYGDFAVTDETASMATLQATGEVHYLYEDGKLREQRGSWLRKPNE